MSTHADFLKPIDSTTASVGMTGVYKIRGEYFYEEVQPIGVITSIKHCESKPKVKPKKYFEQYRHGKKRRNKRTF